MKAKLYVIIGLAAVALALGIWVLMGASTTGSPPIEQEAQAPRPEAQASSPGPAHDLVPDAPAPSQDASAELEPPSAADTPPYPVDLEWLRARLPRSRYWDLAAPTSDPEVAKARAERARQSNAAYGRILAGEASEAEIRDYYEEKRQISADYVELAELVLKEKGEELPEHDRGLFELTANLHRARLAQIARDLQDALARRRAPTSH